MSKDEKEICLYCKWWVQDRITNPQGGMEFVGTPCGTGDCRGACPVGGSGWYKTSRYDWCLNFTNRPDDHESSTFEPIAKPAERVLEKLRSAE